MIIFSVSANVFETPPSYPVHSRHTIECSQSYIHVHFGVCKYGGGGFYLFLYLSIYLYTYGWYAMNYNFMHACVALLCKQ